MNTVTEVRTVRAGGLSARAGGSVRRAFDELECEANAMTPGPPGPAARRSRPTAGPPWWSRRLVRQQPRPAGVAAR